MTEHSKRSPSRTKTEARGLEKSKKSPSLQK